MKIFILSLFISLCLSISLFKSAHAEELISVEAVIKQGLQVKMGELTGAGARVPFSHLQGLVLPEGVLLKSQCVGIIFKNAIDPKISDIAKIQINGGEINAQEFIGFVTK